MGLLDVFSKKKSDVKVDNNKTTSFSVDEEIDFIIKVLGNLGTLSVEKIERVLANEKNFNKDIISKMIRNVDEDNFNNLKNYYGASKLGYGVEKINIYRRRLHEVYNECLQEGLDREETLNKLISVVSVEVDNYERIISSLNDDIKQIEINNSSEVEIRLLVEYTINNYKEQELGFPVNLENCVRNMANELANLEYGGYGEDEVESFVSAANKMIEEGKINGESTNQTLSRINAELFNPRKNRYLSDLDTLKKKIDMIQSSPYISEFEKEQNKQKIITEFNQMNGHTAGVFETIKRLKKALSELDKGGYGEIVLDKFEDDCNDMVNDGRRDGLSDNEVIKSIQSKYDKLVKEYEVHLAKLNEELENNDLLEKKDDLLEDFQDKMGHKVDYKKRLDEYKTNLTNLEYGGYPVDVVDSFINEALEKIDIISSNDELSNYMRQVRSKYRDLVNNYNRELEKLNKEIDKVNNAKKKSDSQKEKEIDNLVLCFKTKFGHNVNYHDLIESYVSDLKNLELGGYGKKMLDEYRTYCNGIIDSEEDSVKIIKMIQDKYNELKKEYLNNVKLFTEWKNLQLKNKTSEEREELEKDLDTKITYMLSLTPEDLYDYYMEDDRKKKADAYRHNYMAAFRYLAREESKKKRNKSLYDKRLEELKNGKVIYSQKDIEEATMKLELASVNNEDIAEEDRIISLIEYIDSTLFRQMLYVESSLSKKGDIKEKI